MLIALLRRLFGPRPAHVPPATFGLAAAITITHAKRKS